MIIEDRVSTLENVLAKFMEQTSLAIAAIHEEVAELRASNARTDRQLLAMQLQADKDRQQAERDRQQDRQEAERIRQRDRQEAERNRQLAEKERQLDRQQAEKDRKDFNKRLAEISDSMGTLIEDMVAPCGMRLAEAIFRDESADTCAIRVRRKHPVKKGEMIELDLLAVGQTKLLFVEVKRHIDPEKAAQLRKKAALIPEYFPEYRERQVHCAVASVYLDPSMISFLNHQKFYGIAMGDDTMEVVNLGQF